MLWYSQLNLKNDRQLKTNERTTTACWTHVTSEFGRVLLCSEHAGEDDVTLNKTSYSSLISCSYMISDLIAAGYQHTTTAVCIQRITQSLLQLEQCVCCTVMSKFSRFVQNTKRLKPVLYSTMWNLQNLWLQDSTDRSPWGILTIVWTLR